MTAFADSSDLQDRWRPLSTEESDRADVLLADVAGMIRQRWPDIDDRITEGSITANEVLRVSVGMVKRAMMASGDGVTSEQEGAGPFSVNRQYVNPTGTLYFSEDDLLLFEPPGYRRGAICGWLA